jgi:ABC-type Mn2+/Zn2+ transport system permease subunit
MFDRVAFAVFLGIVLGVVYLASVVVTGNPWLAIAVTGLAWIVAVLWVRRRPPLPDDAAQRRK